MSEDTEAEAGALGLAAVPQGAELGACRAPRAPAEMEKGGVGSGEWFDETNEPHGLDPMENRGVQLVGAPSVHAAGVPRA